MFLAPRRDEPFGISVVEAMASALPVVCADGGGHRETVGLCEMAEMFPPGDAVAAGEILARLAADPRRRDAYGLELRRIQSEHFTAETQALGTVTAYRSLVGESY
jgi:glycosyltransferase involved in cell wall biosynthesis